MVNNIDKIHDTIDEIRNEVKKSEQTFSKKLSTFGISLDNVEIESKLNKKLVSNICSVGEKIKSWSVILIILLTRLETK